MKGLELKHFKKVASDDAHTTLRHYAGHEIKIKHKALSKEMRAQLESLPTQKPKEAKPIKMADGGKMSDKIGTSEGQAIKPEGDDATLVGSGRLPQVPGSKYGPSKPSAGPTGQSGQTQGGVPGMGNKFQRDDDPNKLAEGGKVQKYAEGTPMAPVAADEASDPRLAELAQTAPTEGDPTFDASAPQAETAGPPDPTAQDAAMDKSMLRKRELYNQYATGNFDPNAQSVMPGRTFGPNGEEPKDFNAKAWQDASKHFDRENQLNSKAAQTQSKSDAATNKARMEAGLAPISMPQSPTAAPVAPQQPLRPANTPMQQGQDPSAPNGIYDVSGLQDVSPSSMYKQGQQAINMQAQAQQQLAQGQAQAAQARQQQLQESEQAFQQGLALKANDIKGAIEAYKADQINPSHYMESKSTGQKIGMAFSLLMGGMAGGASNPAMDFLNKQIDRDISAQKMRMDKAPTIIGAYEKQYGNAVVAETMAKAAQTGIYAAQLEKLAAQAGTPMAQANAMKASMELKQSMIPMIQRAQLMEHATKANNGQGDEAASLNAMRIVDPAMAKERESRYVPGVGMAAVPLSQEDRSTISERKLLGDNIKQLMAFQQKYGGTASGAMSPSIRAQGEALAKQVQDQYRRANQQGVFKPAEAEFVNGVIADSPSSLFSKFTKLPAYKAALQINDGNLAAAYAKVGLKPQQAPAASPQGFVPKSFKPTR